jgi:hypothetical protein
MSEQKESFVRDVGRWDFKRRQNNFVRKDELADDLQIMLNPSIING